MKTLRGVALPFLQQQLLLSVFWRRREFFEIHTKQSNSTRRHDEQCVVPNCI